SSALCLVLLALASCTTPAADGDGTSSDVVVNPEGGEAGGKLLVVAPSGIGSAKIMAQRTGATSSGNVFELAANTSKLVPAGTYCVWTRIDAVDTLPNCDTVVTAGASTMHVLGAVKFTRSTSDLVLGLDWPVDAGIHALVTRAASVPHASGKVRAGLEGF